MKLYIAWSLGSDGLPNLLFALTRKPVKENYVNSICFIEAEMDESKLLDEFPRLTADDLDGAF